MKQRPSMRVKFPGEALFHGIATLSGDAGIPPLMMQMLMPTADTAEQQAAMDAVYAEIASGAFAGEFGAIKGAAYGG